MSKRSLVLLMFKKIILAAIIIFILIGPQLVLADQPTITLTEIMSNPEGADTNREWIEIYNYGNEPVVISGGQASTSWRFKDSGSHLLNLGTSTITLAPGALAILASNDQTFLAEHQNFNGAVIDTTMSLTNSGGEVSLSNNNGQSWFEVVSYATTTEGYSWEKITPTADNQNSNWRQSLVASGSPGQLSPPAPANEVVVVNQASSTPGQEVIVVESATTSDSVAPPPAATTTQAAEVNNQEVVAVQIVSQSGGGSVPAAPAEQKIVISDLLPNPTGADEKGEFIELYNPNLMAIDLDGWKLQDQSPAMFTIEETKVSSTIIGPISYW
ncbi:MAG: lamin tail domain-containing protein, partial [Candidatus Komeilibacteria bacterium]|nr:lamin tail domain-containing protein [Candidatus Komeilibacteria bacterium]